MAEQGTERKPLTYRTTYSHRDEDLAVENPTQCIKEIGEAPHYIIWHQCPRKRGYGKDGLYCKVHAKKHPADEVAK